MNLTQRGILLCNLIHFVKLEKSVSKNACSYLNGHARNYIRSRYLRMDYYRPAVILMSDLQSLDNYCRIASIIIFCSGLTLMCARVCWRLVIYQEYRDINILRYAKLFSIDDLNIRSSVLKEQK